MTRIPNTSHEDLCTRVNRMKTLNMFHPVIYWTQTVHNDFILLCSIVLPPVGHSSNHECKCWNLQDNRAVGRIFIALLRFSVDSPSYIYDKISLNSSWNEKTSRQKIVEKIKSHVFLIYFSPPKIVQFMR